MAKVLLYQPYYHFPGHFKYQFHAFYKHLKELDFTCLGVVGLRKPDEIEKCVDIYSFHYKTRNRRLRILTNLRGFLSIRGLLKDNTISTIHFLDIEIFLLFLFVRFNQQLFKNVRIIITQHSINRLQNQSSSFSTTIYKRLIRKSYGYLEHHNDLKVLANGHNITRWFIKERFLSQKTLITTWWGSQYRNEEINRNVKQANSFLFYGILRKDKNIEYLLHEFSGVTKPYHLHIAGYPRDYTTRQLQDLLKDNGLTEEKVSLELGYLTEERIAQLLKTSSFILLPYSDHNLSNSGPMIDAIQFGCIPVASGYGERQEFINEIGAGYLFYYDHKPLLRDVLYECLTNEEKNNRYCNKIIKIRKQFTWKSIVKDVAEVKRIYK